MSVMSAGLIGSVARASFAAEGSIEPANSPVQNCLVGLYDILNSFVHLLQPPIGYDHRYLQYDVRLAVQARHLTVDLESWSDRAAFCSAG